MTTAKEGHHHRSSLKQKNKPFKGGSARSKSRGRTESNRPASVSKPGRTLNTVAMTKADRRNAAHLAQVARRAELGQERRLFSGRSGVPRNVVLVPLTVSVELGSVLATLRPRSDDNSMSNDSSSVVDYVAEHRQNIRWIGAPFQDWSVMDRVSVADVVVLVVSAQDSSDLEPRVYELLSVMRAQGISSAIGYIQDGARLSKDARAEWTDRLTTEMASVGRVFVQADPESRETAECVRSLCSQKLAGISWRERRPYMLCDASQYDPASQRLAVTGFGRGGQPFSAQRLVHVPGVGSFSVAKIVLASATHGRDSMSVDTMEQVCNPASAESLHEIEPILTSNEGAGEETAMNLSAVSKTTGKLKKKVRVPKGTSSYQAAWLSDAEEVQDEDAEEEEDVVLSDREDIEAESEPESSASMMEEDLDDPYEREAHRLDASKHARDFPDRIDIASGTPARVQLAHCRGLQSLRTASWDPEEGLPAEYSHIYQFENAQRSVQKALNGSVESPFAVGQRLTLVIEGVTPEAAQSIHQGQILYGLLPHEQRTSVLHFTVQPRIHTLFSNEPVVAWIGGIRRFIVQPVYSEHNPAVALHRMLRRVEPGTTAVGTIYAPIHYPPGPVLLFSTAGELLSVGSILAGADPKRIILQRSTLTGASYKVHKRSAVVRWMFDNPADVAWFKPVELTTRSGRRGNIRESVGTHGHFKALFDKPLLSNEPVALHLYRRVFPIWGTTRMI